MVPLYGYSPCSRRKVVLSPAVPPVKPSFQPVSI